MTEVKKKKFSLTKVVEKVSQVLLFLQMLKQFRDSQRDKAD